MALFKELKALLPQLSNSKFLAHLLEPLLFWGVLLGVVAWMLSLWVLKDRKAQVCSLILLAISAFSIYPLLYYRKKAAPLTAPSSRLLNEQNDRLRGSQWAFYVLGSLAVFGIFMTGEGKGKTGTVLTIAITTGGVAVAVFGLWLHEKDIAVFHPDARRPLKSALPPRGRLQPIDQQAGTQSMVHLLPVKARLA